MSAVAGATALSLTLALTGGAPAHAGPTTPAAPAAPTSNSATQSVIVLLRDQLTSTPANRAHVKARRTDARADQGAVLKRLNAHGGRTPTDVDHYTAANAFSATVTADQAATLAADPSVAQVIPNTKITIPAPAAAAPAATRSKVAKRSATVAPANSNVCPSDPKQAAARARGADRHPDRLRRPEAPRPRSPWVRPAAGVKVAYIADGINPDNADFIRADGSNVIADYKAFSADGPAPEDGGAEAYGDASAIAAQGLVSHDLSDFVNPAYPLPTGCNIRILGMAPGASIVALKIDFYTSSIIQAIDYAVSVDHVDVINESFGGAPVPDSAARSAISAFNDMAVAAGSTVTVSSGDAGTTSTIGNPSTDPKVISVAANTNNRGYQQTGYAGARTFGNGKWINDQISSLSSGGFTNAGGTVDLTAPGESGWAVCDPGAPECTNYKGTGSDVQLFGGTSQSAPLTAGAAALVIQAYRYTHGGASPSPALVKKLLTSTASDLGLPTYEQGAGLLDSRAAVEAAATYPGADKSLIPGGVSSNIVLSTSQINISGAPGSTHTATVGVRNVGTKKLTVAASTRDVADSAVATRTDFIDANSSQTFPYPVGGAPWVYKKVTFSVPSGTDRLAAQMIWQGAAKQVGASTVTPVVRVSLFQPDGTYVANSRPQGGPVSANYANLDVRKPVAGTWTAVLYTVAGASGYTGNVTLRTTAQQDRRVGTVSRPGFTLKPGQTKKVRVRLTIPAKTGDYSVAITMASSGGHRTAVAVVERAVVPIKKGAGTFAGTITGGNGRAGAAAQTLTYAFNVPAGKKDIGVGITLPDDPGYQLEGVLVDPNDETQSINSNRYTDANGDLAGQGSTLQLTTANPVAGRWRVIVLVVNPVPGRRLTEDFAGTIGFNQNKSKATGVPNSASTVLAKGSSAAASVAVTNTGIAPMVVQLDPRTNKLRQIPLNSPFGSQSFQLPAHGAPTFLVPPGTRALTATAVSDVPATVELTPSAGGIDVVGGLTEGKNGSTVSVARVRENPGTVSTGIWFTDVAEVGYFGTDGAPTANSTVDLTARTPEFDPAVSSGTGDFWAVATDPNADLGAPVTINPGSTVRIPVTITPTAKVGTVVSGVLNVITPPSFAYATFNTTGDVVTQLPYSYTVGRPNASAAAAASSAAAKARVAAVAKHSTMAKLLQH